MSEVYCGQNDFYGGSIEVIRSKLKEKRSYENKLVELRKKLVESQSLYVQMINAQKLLSTVSDENSEKTLSFITSMVNKTLSEIFKGDTKQIRLIKKLFSGSKPHIVVELTDGQGRTMDMVLQNGAGLRQIVSFMYTLCLIEIRKGRRLLILDERLNGLHKSAKDVLAEIIKIFSSRGFQFIFIEYSLNSIGKIYNVEPQGNSSTLIALDDRTEYSDDMIVLPDVVVPSESVEETEENFSEVII